MQALVTDPPRPHSTRVAAVPDPRPDGGTVLVRPLEVGVCGTDREISEGLFGVAPDGEEALVLGHELVGVVARDGDRFPRGDIVAATVRRSCGRCAPCAAGAPDACDTGDYLERGITRLHGFCSELVAEAPEPLGAAPGRGSPSPRRRRRRGRSACWPSRRRSPSAACATSAPSAAASRGGRAA